MRPQGAREAAELLRWSVRTLNGQGTDAGYRSAFKQALDLKPDGIVLAGFDPASVADEAKKATAADIPHGKRFQAATVPEPLTEQGWQIMDEFNRAFASEPASRYVAPVHITTAANSGGALSWNSEGYRRAYREIWGK